MSAIVKQAPAADLYERDFYSWVQQQVAALREGRIADLDLENLAEEIHDVGSEQLSKVRSAFRIVLVHMLKWDHQPEKRTRSWTTSIATHRSDIADIIEANPSLRRRRAELMQRAYKNARLEAADETGLKRAAFPVECLYTLDEVLDRAFAWPEE